MYKLQRQTVYVVTGMLFSSSFSELWSNKANKHQNNSRVNMYFLHDITNPSMAVKRQSSHIDSVSHSLCLRSAGDVIINYTMHYGAQELWRWRMQLSLLIIVIFMIKLIYVCVCHHSISRWPTYQQVQCRLLLLRSFINRWYYLTLLGQMMSFKKPRRYDIYSGLFKN